MWQERPQGQNAFENSLKCNSGAANFSLKRAENPFVIVAFPLFKHTLGNKLADKGAYLSVSGRRPPVQPMRELCRLTRFVALRPHWAFAQGLANISQELRRLAEFRRSKKWQNRPFEKNCRTEDDGFWRKDCPSAVESAASKPGRRIKNRPGHLCEMSLRSRRAQADRLESAAMAAKRFPSPEETAAVEKSFPHRPVGVGVVAQNIPFRRRGGARASFGDQ